MDGVSARTTGGPAALCILVVGEACPLDHAVDLQAAQTQFTIFRDQERTAAWDRQESIR